MTLNTRLYNLDQINQLMQLSLKNTHKVAEYNLTITALTRIRRLL